MGKESAQEREARVAGIAAGWINREGLGGAASVLVVDDDDGGIGAAVRQAGAQLVRWKRRALGPGKATSWPADVPVDLAILRLPRDWASFALQVHAALSRLAPGGRIWVLGGNDEGVKSAPRHLADLGLSTVETLWIKKRVRILEVLLQQGDDEGEGVAVRGSLDQWREQVALELPGAGSHTLFSYPGLFAHGRLDQASALLLGVLPDIRPNARVLDMGCGAGALSLGALARQPAARLILTDVDAIAVQAARENLPGAVVLLGDGWSAVELGARFDLILSNPPLHRGHADDREVLDALIQQAPMRLNKGGRLVLVTWRTAGIARAMEQALQKVEVLAEDGRFQVWTGILR